jgi:hypothetical protein
LIDSIVVVFILYEDFLCVGTVQSEQQGRHELPVLTNYTSYKQSSYHSININFHNRFVTNLVIWDF